MGVVIYSNQDAQQIRLQFEGIFHPPLLQIQYRVPGNAPVHELQLQRREGRPVLCGNQEGIAMAQNVIRIGAPAPDLPSE